MDKGCTVCIEEQINERNLGPCDFVESSPHQTVKVKFHDPLIPNYHKFPVIGVWIFEYWFIIYYFVPFNSFWFDWFMASSCPLLYLKIFETMLSPWNGWAAPVLSTVFTGNSPNLSVASNIVVWTMCLFSPWAPLWILSPLWDGGSL